MAMQPLKSMAYDDYERYQRSGHGATDPEPPEHPLNLRFSLASEDMEKAGAEGGDIDDVMHFSAMGEVTSIMTGRDDSRIEFQIGQFAGADGKFFELSQPAHICLCGPELEKIGLDADCERGDMIHLIGTVRMEGRSDTEWGGDTVSLQVTELTFEDESTESRDEG